MFVGDETLVPERSFPDFRSFLEREVLGPNYPVKHLIEQARSKGHISRGKPGRGSAAVTTRDAAMLLAGALSGDTPATASDAMGKLAELKPHESTHGVHFPIYTSLEEYWWNRRFIDAFTVVLDAWRKDDCLDFNDFEVSIVREPRLSAGIKWNDVPGERDELVSYVSGDATDDERFISRRVVRSSIYGDTLKLVADWLEGRSPFCE